MINVFKKLPIKVRYKNTKEPLEIPYAIYYRGETERIFADNHVYKQNVVYVMEYYFNDLNIKLEEEIEKILIENQCIFNKSEDIEVTESVTLIRYEIRRTK